jgi:hypothetical protein
VLTHQRLQLGNELRAAAYGEIGLDPLLERQQPSLLEPFGFGGGKRLVEDVGERRAAPERQRAPQRLARGHGVSGGELRAPPLDELLEPH